MLFVIIFSSHKVFEEFKVDLENRWRGLLDDAIQDAVFLNSRNNEVSQQNEQLKLGTYQNNA